MPSHKDTYKLALDEFVRPGIKEFLNWLETTDFYTAPCSTKYHLSREGGLVEHSLNVYECLKNNVVRLALGLERESLAIIALGHDVCKADFYGQEMRNVKENGTWVQKPYYTVQDKFPFGHGEKSVHILSHFIKLSKAEALAVRWHMGGFTEGGFSTQQAMSEAAKITPLVTLLQIADLEATYLKEVERSVNS